MTTFHRNKHFPTRRDVLIGGSLALGFTDAFADDAPRTPGGYAPPKASRTILQGVRFDHAQDVGPKYYDRFKRWDKTPRGRRDPNLCAALVEIPNGGKRAALYWDSKMAVDADGASPDVLKQSSGASKHTSLRFRNGAALNAEIVPYFVAPAIDRLPEGAEKYPNGPWEDSGDSFIEDLGLTPGNLGVVIFKDKIAGAIFADEGPAMKIGEASIRTHELIRRPPAPWRNKEKKILLDASEDKDVLTIVFRDAFFDVNEFGPDKQPEMAEAIQKKALAAFEEFRKAQG